MLGINEMECHIDALRKKTHELEVALQARSRGSTRRPLSKHDRSLAARNRYLEQVSLKKSCA